MNLLSVIIVNWNSAAYLRACLRSIAQNAGAMPVEIIVVDNASTSDNLDWVGTEFPSVTVIRNSENTGFARANNVGSNACRGETVLFLNPDTEIVGSALQTMASTLEQTPDAAIVGCRLLNTDGSVQTTSILRYPRLWNQLLGTDILHRRLPRLPLWGIAPLFEHASKAVDVEAVSGACLMMRHSAFEAVGRFSEEYFMYSEDVDLCYKAVRAGWRCVYTGEATVIHHGGGSSRQGAATGWSAAAQCGSKLQFMRKTRGAAYGHAYRVAIGLSAAARLALLGALSLLRGRQHASIRKWAAILEWAVAPASSVRRLAAAQGK